MAAAAALLVSVVGVPAHADAEWVPNPRWSQLNVQAADGIFQQNLRVYDSSGAPATDDAGQHNNVYVRIGVNRVTLTYDCTKQQGLNAAPASNCANKRVQFAVDTSAFDYNEKTKAFTRIKLAIAGQPRSASSFNGFRSGVKDEGIIYRNEIADIRGVAQLDITIENAGTTASGNVVMSDDFLGVSVSNCDRTIQNNTCDDSDVAGTTDTIGPMNVQFEEAGYYPQVSMLNQDQSPALPNCGGLSWAKDETWGWSVYKRSWFSEYACVYTKSYQVGDVVRIPYRVRDIWGQPMANQPVDFVHPSGGNNCGTVGCKWGPEVSHKYTDKNGYVTFTVQNLNTPNEACSNQGYNSDTKETHTCAIGMEFKATTGKQPESQDLFWPQFLNSTAIQLRYVNMHVITRGTRTTKSLTDYVYDETGLKNPALALATNGANVNADFNDSTVRARLDIKPLYNANPDKICFIQIDPKNPQKVRRLPSSSPKRPFCMERSVLYAPDVTVTATNGGKVLRVCPDSNGAAVCKAAGLPTAWDITDVSQMKDEEVFGFQYLSELLFTATRPGRTIFTIHVGGEDYDVYQNFVTSPTNARSIVATATTMSALPGAPVKARFRVVDRFGNGYANIPVSITQTGGELTAADTITDADGFATATLSSPAAATQSVTAVITADGMTQIGNPANAAIDLAASATTATTAVNWANAYATAAPTLAGNAKVGSVLTATAGTWVSKGTVSLKYAWYSCPSARAATASAAMAAMAGCTIIKGANANRLTLPAATAGRFVAVRVTGTWVATTVETASATSVKVKK